MCRHYKSPCLLIEFTPDRPFSLQVSMHLLALCILIILNNVCHVICMLGSV